MADKKRLIDAEALCDLITATFPPMSYNAMYMAIENAPTVEAVEVVHGRWEPRPHHKFNSTGQLIKYCDFYYCSECGTERPMAPPYNYCPNCGAKMDGGDEDD